MSLFLVPIAIMFGVQALKMFAEGLNGKFSWQHLNNYGGMPSAHTALLGSLTFMLIYNYGWNSDSAAISLILLFIVIRDALGFRWQLGIHAQIINRLIKDLPDKMEYKYPVLNERLGHTALEVAVGLLIGILTSYLFLVIV